MRAIYCVFDLINFSFLMAPCSFVPTESAKAAVPAKYFLTLVKADSDHPGGTQPDKIAFLGLSDDSGRNSPQSDPWHGLKVTYKILTPLFSP